MTNLDRPTLRELIERAQSDMDAHAGTGAAYQNGTDENVLSYVNAGGLHGMYGTLETHAKNLFIETCDIFHLYRRADFYGIVPLDSQYAEGFALFSGNAGSVILKDTKLIRTSDRREYITIEKAVIQSSGNAIASVKALLPGEAGNSAAGVKLTLVYPVSGVNSEAVVYDDGIAGGVDTEDTERLRARVRDRVRKPPRGGALHDYEAWTFAADATITRVWATQGEMGAGSISIRFVCDGNADILPTQTIRDNVKAYIDSVRPAGQALLYVLAPILKPIDFTISLYVSDTQTIRDGVSAEIADIFNQKTKPNVTIPLTHFAQAISNAAGEYDHEIQEPESNITSANPGEMPVLGNIIFV
jgi:uncharacterized phage protein gp47/JayE